MVNSKFMSKVFSFSLFIIVFACVGNAQFSKNGKKTYKKIVDLWSVKQYSSFLKKYPNSKFKIEISRRFQCLERNNNFMDVITASDSNAMKLYISKYDTCTFCSNYLPNKLLNNLGNGTRDLEVLRDSLNNIRAYSFWTNYVLNINSNDFKVIDFFIKKYPQSYLVSIAQDSILSRKDRYYWNLATKNDNAISYRLYLDSVENGIHSEYAAMFYKENILGEKLLKEQSHKELAIGLRQLKSLNDQSRFEKSILQKLEAIENKDFLLSKRKNNFVDWLEFEKKYPNGFYFDEVNKIVRKLGGISPDAKRSPYATVYYQQNSTNTPIKCTFSQSGVTKKEIVINAQSSEYFMLPNGKYQVNVIDVNTKKILTSGQEILFGNMIGYNWSKPGK